MTTQSHNPQLFPQNDNSWHDAILSKVGNHPNHRLNGIWKWHDKDGRIKFVKYRIDHYEDGKFIKKSVLPLSRFNDKWDFSLRWERQRNQPSSYCLIIARQLTQEDIKVGRQPIGKP